MERFLKSVLLGTVAAAAVPSVFTIAAAFYLITSPLNGQPDGFAVAYLAALPTLISFATIFAASVLIGLPTTMLLRHYQAESGRNYLLVGGISGFFLPLAGLLYLNAPSGYLSCILGAFAGAVTAGAWWQLRSFPKGG